MFQGLQGGRLKGEQEKAYACNLLGKVDTDKIMIVKVLNLILEAGALGTCWNGV